LSETSNIRSIMGGKSKKLICVITDRKAQSKGWRPFDFRVIFSHNNAKRKKIMLISRQDLQDFSGLTCKSRLNLVNPVKDCAWRQ